MLKHIKGLIEEAWDKRLMLENEDTKQAINEAVEMLDKGLIRVAEPSSNGWILNEWVKKAVILYFPIHKMETIEAFPFEFHDKIPLKKHFAQSGVRVVPHALARYGSFLSEGVILMPSYVNIGAYVGRNTMIDTWATVGSCAQVGANVHVSGGVGIGGVLEPLQAKPVIIEDDCFIGSRSIIVEGAHIRKGAVIGAGVLITSSTKIIDVSGKEAVTYIGEVPENAVVIPGSLKKEFRAGTFYVPCSLIIGKRKPSTDLITSLNDALREYNVVV